MRYSNIKLKSLRGALATATVVATLTLLPSVTPLAQKKESPNVTGISSRPTSKGKVVSLSTDGPLKGTQTWQDPDGTFNVTLPGSNASQLKDLPPGVQVRRVGDSLQIAIPAKSGANVTVQPRSNGIDLVMEGDTEGQKGASAAGAQPGAQYGAGSNGARPQSASAAQPARASEDTLPETTMPSSSSASTGSETVASSSAPSSPAQTASASSTSSSTATTAPAAVPAAAQPQAEDDGGIMSWVFSYTGLAVLLVVVLGIFLIVRRREEGGWEHVEDEEKKKTEPVDLMAEETARTGERRRRNRREGFEGGRRATDAPQAALVKAQSSVPQKEDARGEPVMEVRQDKLVPTALFGAYRVDQEIGKLLMGQPHRMDVLASRAPDDRRAMEASLLKVLNSPEVGADGQRRVRQALEDYGFVARQSAALLLSPDAYERASAARVLGEVQSPTSLPFLLEALYDAEQIVRTQAVTTIGALKLPSAIGALLDMARRYPDMPQHLLSRALSDCSVECMDFIDVTPAGRALIRIGDDGFFTGEITALEPATVFEALPEYFDDELLSEALHRLADADAEARTAAAQSLAQYPVSRSVDALTVLASQDPEASVRAAAVTSLGAIDHETVFAPVLMAFADEAREVRAAAARALSRLNFDRADAYVRLIETCDHERLQKVARACIDAGMAKQAFDRLASEDRRQMYESFTLLSLLARAGESAPILEAIENHGNINVRLAAVKLIGISGHANVIERLRELAVVDNIPEKLRMALMEVVYKLDQAAEAAPLQPEPVDC